MIIDDEKFCNFVRAFWRRIEPHKNRFGPDLPTPLPVEFNAHMTTALLIFCGETHGNTPTAWAYRKNGKIHALTPFENENEYKGYEKISLYTSPPVRKQLQQDRIFEMAMNTLDPIDSCCGVEDKFCNEDVWRGNLINFARSIEKAHGIE